jgi:hypothetical protein
MPVLSGICSLFAVFLEFQSSLQQVQDAGKGDCAFFLSTAAEISVITSPIGKGSMKVAAG